jgi:L-seryl-tRNA(Ser) seleniumtransferase
MGGGDSTIFARRGIPRIINAAGTLTRLSSGPLAPGVAEAIAAADAAAVEIEALQAHASGVIAAATGAEAGLVTAGAAAGLMLAAAACLAGLDVARMNALPKAGRRNRIIVARGHRNGYDHALRAAGARLVEVGLPEPAAGAGCRDTEACDYAAAISGRTAAILYVATPAAAPPLAAVVAVARAERIPVIVDAAAELPPQSNLRAFIAAGADLVVFSGGKAIGGPAGSGILCGRADLVVSAALQSLDADVAWDDWTPPAGFIDKSRLTGLPRQGIGRACKTGKHEVIGLLVALEHFLAEGDGARHARWLARCEAVMAGLAPLAAKVRIRNASATDRIPMLEMRFDGAGMAADFARIRLARPAPVHLARDPAAPECLLVNPVALRDAEVAALIAALVS